MVVYRQAYTFSNGATLSKVADLNTPVPGGSGSFTDFYSPVISGDNIAFLGSGSESNGLYFFDGTTLTIAADVNTPIPGRSENFSAFSDLTISGANIAFEGLVAGGGGIYLYNGTTFSKVADLNTPIPGGYGNFSGFSGPVTNGNNIAFFGDGDGQIGYYLASLVQCDGTLSADLKIYLSIVEFNGAYFQGTLQCQVDMDGSIMCRVTSYAANPASINGCQPSTLSADKKHLHIRSGIYNNVSYHADFESVPTTDGQMWFKLTDYGPN